MVNIANLRTRDIRVIVCDLDGTLLNSEKRISAKNLQAIKSARAKGVFTTICSGRVPAMLEAYSRELSIEIPLIAANGAVVYDVASKCHLHTEKIPADVIAPVLDFFRHYDYGVLGSAGGYFTPVSKRIERFIQYNEIARQQGLEEIPLHYIEDGNYNQALSMDIYKVLVSELSPGDIDKARDFLNTRSDLEYTSSDHGLLDISAIGVNKGMGVTKLARLMGLPKDAVCAIGDFFNDISMFRSAGLSIAMGNAHPDVKSEAMAVTTSNNADGVAIAIEKYIL